MIALVIIAAFILTWFAFGGLRSPLGKAFVLLSIVALIVIGGVVTYARNLDRQAPLIHPYVSNGAQPIKCGPGEHKLYDSEYDMQHDINPTRCSPDKSPNAQIDNGSGLYNLPGPILVPSK